MPKRFSSSPLYCYILTTHTLSSLRIIKLSCWNHLKSAHNIVHMQTRKPKSSNTRFASYSFTRLFLLFHSFSAMEDCPSTCISCIEWKHERLRPYHAPLHISFHSPSSPNLLSPSTSWSLNNDHPPLWLQQRQINGILEARTKSHTRNEPIQEPLQSPPLHLLRHQLRHPHRPQPTQATFYAVNPRFH